MNGQSKVLLVLHDKEHQRRQTRTCSALPRVGESIFHDGGESYLVKHVRTDSDEYVAEVHAERVSTNTYSRPG